MDCPAFDGSEKKAAGRKVGRATTWAGDSVGMENVITYINENFTGKLPFRHWRSRRCLASTILFACLRTIPAVHLMSIFLILELARGKYMLKNTSLSVKDISLDAGFPSESAFARFKKKMELHLQNTAARPHNYSYITAFFRNKIRNFRKYSIVLFIV